MIFIFVILIFTTKVQYLALFQSVYRTRKNLPIFLCGDKTISELKNFRKKVFQCFTSVQCGRAWLQSLPWNIGLGIVDGDWRTKYCLFSLSVTHSCFHKLLSLTFEVYSGYIIDNCKFSNFPHSALIPLTIDNCFPAWAIHKHPGDRICRDVAPEHILLFYAEINSDSRP